LAGGTSIEVYGFRFQAGATVFIGGNPATSVGFSASTLLTCITPPGTAGNADVTVVNPSGETATKPGEFTYSGPPDLISVSPTLGPPAGGTRITLTGSDFQAGAQVSVGGTTCTNIDDSGVPNQVECDTPPGSTGAADVAVANPGGGSDTLTGGFTYMLSVLNTDPYSGQANVFINDPITIQFSAPVDPGSVNSNTISIRDASLGVPPGRFEVQNDTVRFIPQYPPGLAPMQTYSVTLSGYPTTPVIQTPQGIPLESPYTFSFDSGTAARPDTTPPTILSCNIASGATGISRDTNIEITFSEPIDTNIVLSGFSLTNLGNANAVPGTLTMIQNQTVLRFDPENGAFPGYLNSLTQFEIRLTSSVRDLAGLSIQDPTNPPSYPPWVRTFTTSSVPAAASARGPFDEDFSSNKHEDIPTTTAEWNTIVPQSLASAVFPAPLTVVDPAPVGLVGTGSAPFDSGTGNTGWRVATLILASEIQTALGQPLTQVANQPITRLLCKLGPGGVSTGATYGNLVVRLGITSNTSFPSGATTFSSLYTQSGPQVVSRLANFTVNAATVNPPGYIEVPVVPNFLYPGGNNDNLIVDIEVRSASATNAISFVNPGVSSIRRRALCQNPGANVDTVQTLDVNVPMFTFTFGGGLGTGGVDGAAASATTFAFPFGSGSDFDLRTGGTLDTNQAGFGFGHMKCNSFRVAAGATLTVTFGGGGPANPFIVRAGRTVRIEGRILAEGGPGGGPPGANLAGGSGGLRGPGGGKGGGGGAGAQSGSGIAGSPGTGLDGGTTSSAGAGQGGAGGAAGAGGGSGGFGAAGASGQSAGTASGGSGGNAWGSPSILFLQGGAGGGGGGGGVAVSGAGGAGGGGGGGYVQIVTDRNMEIGPAARIGARGGSGGSPGTGGTGGGGGGGAGGTVVLQALQLTFTGNGATVSAEGGHGGLSAGSGGHGGPVTSPPLSQGLAHGRIRIDASVLNASGCTFTPDATSGLMTTRPGFPLSGTYLPQGQMQWQSTGRSIFIDTGCSLPWYTTAEITFTSTPGITAVYVNFEGADPNILGQPVSPVSLYSTGAGPGGAESLPVGQNPAVIDLNSGDINGGAGSGGVSPLGVTALNGYQFVRFVLILETQSGTATAQVGRVVVRYQY
jgi:hypothetical protein